MPESRGGGSSRGDGWPSTDRAGPGNAPSWRMEGAEEEEEEDSSGNSPDVPDADLKEQKESEQRLVHVLSVMPPPKP